MKDQDNMSQTKTTSPIEMFSRGNYLDEPQDTEFKITIINLIEEFKEFIRDTSKHLNALKEDRNKLPIEVQENTIG